VPEAAVDKDGALLSCEDDVRAGTPFKARPDVDAIAESCPVQGPANDQLGFRVLCLIRENGARSSLAGCPQDLVIELTRLAGEKATS
jgi:hypothetical protein